MLQETVIVCLPVGRLRRLSMFHIVVTAILQELENWGKVYSVFVEFKYFKKPNTQNEQLVVVETVSRCM